MYELPEFEFLTHERILSQKYLEQDDGYEWRFINTFSGVNGATIGRTTPSAEAAATPPSEVGEHFRKAFIAFRIAKYAPMPYISGGSPTAYEFNRARFSRSVSSGRIAISFGTDWMSWTLYVESAFERSLPSES